MAKLWDKGYSLDSLIEEFTVGNDYFLDLRLAEFDCLGSMAHAEMLVSAGLLSEAEGAQLRKGLREILAEIDAGAFTISREDEDCHTAIENRLVASCGEAGKRIHTGRSRNDQVLTALRLFSKENLLTVMQGLLACAEECIRFAETHAAVPMPGRTHTHKAMLSSVGLWAASFGEELTDMYRLLDTAYRLNDRSPLGSAASYGAPLPLDREMTARLLGFAGPQNNVLYVNNSRGKFEAIILDALEMVMLTLNKLAADLILFTLPEFGYFTLPDELCPGSSIMPQKKNPDVLELIRARAGVVAGYGAQVKNVIRSLVSGYNRDLQETKEPLIRGFDTVRLSLEVMTEVVRKLGVHEGRLREACTPELFAADAAYELVEKGMSFRDAYRDVGVRLEGPEKGSDAAAGGPAGTDLDGALKKRISTGTSGNLSLEPIKNKIEELRKTTAERRAAMKTVRGHFGGMKKHIDHETSL